MIADRQTETKCWTAPVLEELTIDLTAIALATKTSTADGVRPKSNS